ncbi:MAG: S8 family serine peptidase, partial [Caldilineales bacterium]|nr:S8 family serine peptidase [Caldilineales bacterium]
MGEQKIHPDLRRVLDTVDPTAQVPVIVRFRREPGIPTSQQQIANLPMAAAYQILPAVPAEGTAANIRTLADDPQIERIWYDLPVHTMLDVSVPLIQAPRVWAGSGQGAGIKVGVLDTGCDLNHADVKDRVRSSADFTGKGNAQDGNGHGTHVAGIIAGSGAASAGRYRGVAPAADLYIAKVLDDRGGGRMSGVISGLEWAVDQGVDIINMSLGSDGACDGTDALS